MPKGFIIKTTPNPAEPVSMKVIGSLTPDEGLELCMIALRGVLYQSADSLIKTMKKPEDFTDAEHEEHIKAVLYDKAVVNFSYLVDEFFPKAIELKAKEDGFDKYIKQNKEVGK